MTAEEAWVVNERIKLWSPEEQAVWHRLLADKPDEANVLADLVFHLNVRPITPERGAPPP